MFSRVYSCTCFGIEGRIVRVEADMSNGLPGFHVVGEVGQEVKEASARVRTAMKNKGFKLPPKKYLINLAPAGFRKNGTAFDMAIAVAICHCIEPLPSKPLSESVFIGELSLNGEVVGVNGILPMVDCARKKGFVRCYVPMDNMNEARIIEGIEVCGVKSFAALINTLKTPNRHAEGICMGSEENFYDLQNLPDKDPAYDAGEGVNVSLMTRMMEMGDKLPDFRDIVGQEAAKRAIMVSAAGWHHMLMIGPPGSGKTMLAERMPYIMPKMSMEDQITLTKIYSVAGELQKLSHLIDIRPFRRPHHSVSDKVLIGGGMYPAPGEMSLSHEGILFLDEFPEFSRTAVEALRQPLEMKEVRIHRLSGTYIFPAAPLIIAASNPCPCGYYPDREICSCTKRQIQNYQKRISGPIRERIDLCVYVERVRYQDIHGPRDGMDTATMREKILMAADIQKERFKGMNIQRNSEMTGEMINRFCALDDISGHFMEEVYEQFHLSARVHQNILKVARTIADLEGSEQIEIGHLSEAVCYRLPDEGYAGHL